jgi:hypothetical protein
MRDEEKKDGDLKGLKKPKSKIELKMPIGPCRP